MTTQKNVRVFHNSDYDCPIAWPGQTLTPPNPLTDYIDIMAGTGVTDMLINVNCQRTNYRSDVWEAVWDGQDYGDNQRSFYEQGGDYPEHMMRLCRNKGLTPWISIRMNDSHAAPESMHDDPYHSTFWREHPDWWVVPYRFTDWYDRALNYGQQEVRDHYMALIREVCRRYDMDGLELDFMRFVRYFRPGHEQEGAELMNAFVADVRRVVEASAQRVGHKIELGVRVPTRPQTARGLGLDAIAWARQGLVDLIVAQSDFKSSDSDIAVELWKELLAGASVKLAAGFEDAIDSGGHVCLWNMIETHQSRPTVQQARGLVLAALHRGADGIYLMNHHDGAHFWDDVDDGLSHTRSDVEIFRQYLKDIGSSEALRAKPRSHVVTRIYPRAEGEPAAAALPYTGRWGVFRLYIGPRPTTGQTTQVLLEIDNGEKPEQVRLNGTLCSWRQTDGNWHTYEVEVESVNDGYNVVEVGADREVKITWVEIAVRGLR